MEHHSVQHANSKRIYYLDFARGLAVFFMIMQHAMILHERTSGEGATLLGNLFVLLGTAPAAPVFIFIMGIFTNRSQKSVKENMIRGCKLFAFGYVLNFIRFTLPLVLVGGPYDSESDPFALLFVVDIFQLAGLSLICFSGLKKYAEHVYILPTFILVLLLVSPRLWGLNHQLFLWDPLWGAGVHTDFPLFPWGIYFLLGMYASNNLPGQTLEKPVKKKLIWGSLILGAIGLATLPFFPVGDYYRSGLSIHFLMISFIFVWLMFTNYLVTLLNQKGFHQVLRVIYFWSYHVTEIYIIQWVLFGWSILLLGAHQMADYVAMFIGFLVVLITSFLLKFTRVKSCLPKL
ncbi:heparan-alpha-glucosaminide N-acetyltransferase domain-containing protein [Brevibacillus ginsengisoli]|uniref:heparan-alpha-glucosaminide N-acetyltransferase domain-containing protein n=1 Tax=Brevibacillus ginsengisoli TaxID=363854 RepID=UPI003CF52F2A